MRKIKSVENNQVDENAKNLVEVKSDRLKEKFNSYFQSELNIDDYSRDYTFEMTDNSTNESSMKRLITDIRKFIFTYEKEAKLNGLVISRIFQGIGTPKFPAEIWGRNRLFWRCHLDFDFEQIVKVATEQLIHN
jgi:hypothetical protein